MKKNIDTATIVNELQGSVFFPAKPAETKVPEKTFLTPPPSRQPETTQEQQKDTMIPRHHDTIIEAIRVAVKVFGKEAATHRFTLEEKAAIANIVFTYKTQGTKTSENEVARIAINFVVNDYNENGENSVLHKAIKALNE